MGEPRLPFYRGPRHGQPLPLSPRQEQIAELVGQGHQNAEIGARLNLTEGTVKVYLQQIYRRLGYHLRSESNRILLVRRAVLRESAAKEKPPGA